MKKNIWYFGVIVTLLCGSFQGCSSASKKEDQATVAAEMPQTVNADENTSGDSDNGKAMGLQTVNFAFDSFALVESSKSILENNATILKGNPSVKIQIEGHCSQEGSIQYNIALGEKRAQATKKYLQDLGVASDRMNVISFGKERPLDPSLSEEAKAKNRRANFVITAK